jgi:chromosome segregation ATPase
MAEKGKGFVAKILEGNKTVRMPEGASSDEIVEGMLSAVNILKIRCVDAEKQARDALTEKDKLVRECSDLKARLVQAGESGMNKSILETLKMQIATADRKCSEYERQCKALDKAVLEEGKARNVAEQKIATAEARCEAANQIITNLKTDLDYARNELSRLRDNAKAIARNPRPAPRTVEINVSERDFQGNIKSMTVSPT